MDTAPNQPQEWLDFKYSARDGLRLAGRKYGWQHMGSEAVICLPGLTRNSSDFHDLALHLSTDEKRPLRVLCLDFRGRGASEYDSDWENYNPLTEANDVLDGITATGLGDVHVVGTSRGGLVAFAMASMRPGMFQSVTLNDVGPVLDGKGLVRIRAYLDRLKAPSGFADAAETLKAIGSAYFPTRSDADWMEEARRVYKDENGKLRHRFDTKLVKTLKAINLDQPLPALWVPFLALSHVPVLAIRGKNSDLLSKETLNEMAERHPNLQAIEIENQGHAPDLGTEGLPELIQKFIWSAAHK